MADAQPAGSPASSSICIRGGEAAPTRARRHLRALLDASVPREREADAALIVSELVTNSVLHADVGSDQTLLLELTTSGDRLLIAVTDPGSELKPQLLPPDATRTGGFGLRLVDDMCAAWGVARDAGGRTRVWCELPLATS